ncbi:MAG: glycosyltransferase [Candidatus Liptonbacteria bacterium]|nr:glycosyltransferase [Candidatus Liptonbacteria bacterium]
MKIIYAGIRKDQYDENRRGFTFEYNNFYLTLKGMSEISSNSEGAGVEVIEYPFDAIVRVGKRRFNDDFLALAAREKPDVVFIFPYTDEFEERTLDELKKHTTTLAWFADDHWRLWNYSRFLAPHLSWAVTTWSKAPEEYARYGISNIIRSQWACNPRMWHPVEVPAKDIEVSFIGQRNSARTRIVEELRRAGIEVWVRGWGWPEGRLSEEEMIAGISRSKICLNFNNPPDRWRAKLFARLLFRRSGTRIVPDVFHFPSNVRSWLNMAIPQIKARPFELAGCGAFVISGYADDLERYYEEGKEMAFYRTIPELIEKIRHYSARPEEREGIAKAGYERTLRDHTYEARFREIFSKMGVFRGV